MSLQTFVPSPTFEEYRQAFKEHYVLERSDDGVIVARAHTKGSSVQLSVENHRAVGQLFKAIGADPQNEVMIFTGTGPSFMTSVDPEGFALEEEDLEYWAYEYAFKDGRRNVLSLVLDLEIPTIGALNGPGFHSELCLMCDLTICSENAVIPGDSAPLEEESRRRSRRRLRDSDVRASGSQGGHPHRWRERGRRGGLLLRPAASSPRGLARGRDLTKRGRLTGSARSSRRWAWTLALSYAAKGEDGREVVEYLDVVEPPLS